MCNYIICPPLDFFVQFGPGDHLQCSVAFNTHQLVVWCVWFGCKVAFGVADQP